jgi:hypothetical protein
MLIALIAFVFPYQLFFSVGITRLRANRQLRLAPSNLGSFLEGKNHTAVPWWGAAGK